MHWNKPAVIAACPGRLLDYVESGDLKINQVRVMVLDEADRLLDMGFEYAISSIVKEVPEDRQSLMFSATFPPDVKDLAKAFMYRDAIHIQIGSADALTGNKDITQEVC